MAKNKPAKGNVGPSGQTVAPPLPPGVKLLGTLEGYQDAVVSVAFDPQGGTLASVSRASVTSTDACRIGACDPLGHGLSLALAGVAISSRAFLSPSAGPCQTPLR